MFVDNQKIVPTDLNAALQDVIPYLTLTGTDDEDKTGTCAIQVKDAAGNDLAQRFLVHTWIANAEYSEPDPQTGFSVLTGEQQWQFEALADFLVISDATGLVDMNIIVAAAASVYVMAEIDGRIWSSGEIAITGA